MLRGVGRDLFTIGVGNALLIAAFACCWQGARAFDGGRRCGAACCVTPLLWLGVCLVPGFMDNVALPVVLSSLLVAPLLAMAAFEFWRGRAETLPSRWPVIVLFGSFALFFAAPHSADRRRCRFRSARCRCSRAGSAPST